MKNPARLRALGAMSEGAVKASPGRLIALGEIVGTHGVGGLLRLRPYDSASAALAAAQTVFLAPLSSEREKKDGNPCGRVERFAAAEPESTPRPMLLLSARPHGRVLLLRIEGVDRPEAAAPLVGSVLSISETDLPAPGPGEFYAYQLEGLEVVTAAGDRVGIIADSFATGSNDVLVVRDGEREFLIPCIADVVRRVDVGSGRIVIEPIEGLLA